MWTVRAIMQTQVLTVPPHMSVRELVQVLAKARISGAPVVNSTGDIMGVVSSTDVVALAAWGAQTRGRNPWQDDEGAGDEETAEYFRVAELLPEVQTAGPIGDVECLVEDIMTPAAYAVRSETTLAELAQFLVRRHIHRALVVDEGKLVGIVTTFDVLRAIAGDADLVSEQELALAES
jgi:CBS domain-containing protein